MEEPQIVGIRADYAFVRDAETVLLRLTLRFDPEADGVALPLGPPEIIALRTTCAPGPLTATADGADIGQRIMTFVAARGAPGAAARLVLDFALARSGAAALPADLFALAVDLDLGGGKLVAARPAMPGDGDLRSFAAAFEAAWQGFDGADGTLKLAAAEAPGAPALWCVRVSAAKGIGLTGRAAPPAWYALPPLSDHPLGGRVVNPATGDSETFAGVDLDKWWAHYIAALERLCAPAMAEAVRAASAAAADSLAATRAALASSLAARLTPIDLDAAEAGGAPMRSAFARAAAAADLACIAAAALPVSVARGAGDAGPARVVQGWALPIGAASAGTLCPVAVPLDAGPQYLVIAVPDTATALSARFEGAWLESGDATLPTLRLLLPDQADFGLGEIGPLAVPKPLLTQPDGLLISAVRAVSAFADPRSIDDALCWAIEADLLVTPAPGDRLELALHLGRSPPDIAPAPVPQAGGDLFGALARFVRFETGQAGRDKPLDAARLDRAAALAAAVAEALPAWQAPAATAAAPPLPEGRYWIDFGPGALSLTRCADAAGTLPPWPAIAGFATPAGEAQTGLYAPVGPAQPLRLSIPGLRLPAMRAAWLTARMRRNLGLAGAGRTNPAFIHDGPVVTSGAASPCLLWKATIAGVADATLAAALDRLFAPLGDDPATPYALGIEVTYHSPLTSLAGDPGVDMPILLVPPVAIGVGAEPVAALKAELETAIASWWRDHFPSEGDGAEFRLTLTLWDADGHSPLARLSDLPIPLPADLAGWREPGAS